VPGLLGYGSASGCPVKRWVEAQAVSEEFEADAPRLRHALDGRTPGRGVPFDTLCDEKALTTADIPGRPAPECPRCDYAWRASEGIPQRSVHVWPGAGVHGGAV
jgi:hypothetical protein